MPGVPYEQDPVLHSAWYGYKDAPFPRHQQGNHSQREKALFSVVRTNVFLVGTAK